MFRIPRALLLAVLLCPLAVGAVQTQHFKIRTAKDLVSLCGVSADDPKVTAAIHFCHGYGIGAWHYYVAITKPSSPTEIVCLSDPKPTRDEALAQYVAWARAHPQYLGEPAVDNLFRFLESTFPCTK